MLNVIFDNQVGLLVGEHPADLLAGIHVVLDTLHHTAVFPVPDHLGAEIPDAAVEAELGHGVVRLEELAEGLLLVVTHIHHGAFCRHFKFTFDHFTEKKTFEKTSIAEK